MGQSELEGQIQLESTGTTEGAVSNGEMQEKSPARGYLRVSFKDREIDIASIMAGIIYAIARTKGIIRLETAFPTSLSCSFGMTHFITPLSGLIHTVCNGFLSAMIKSEDFY